MDPSHYSGSRYPAYNGVGTLQPHLTGPDFEQYQPLNQYARGPTVLHVPTDYLPSMLPSQYPTPYNPASALSARGDWHLTPTVWRIL